MTGTWRDTLFVWEGSLELVAPTKETAINNNNNNSKSAKEEQHRDDNIHWKGSWVGCQDCPDARTAATPNHLAFTASVMEFDVASVSTVPKIERGLKCWHYDMTGGSGWDLGDGDDEKTRHKDHTHAIVVCNDPLGIRTNTSAATIIIEEHDSFLQEQEHALAVAKGENDFGAFISVGYCFTKNNHKNKKGRRLILARRYLDHGDARAKWAVDELYQHVLLGCDPGLWQGFTKRPFIARLPVASWRMNHMHAKKVALPRGKRKHDGDTVTATTSTKTELLPPLHIPCDGAAFLPDFEITQEGTIRTSNVRWLEQCQGCGKEVRDLGKATFVSVALENGPDDRAAAHTVIENENVTAFCKPACAILFGAVGWADAGHKWAQAKENSGLKLKGNRQDSFWQAIDSNETAKKTMVGKGWQLDGCVDPLLCAL